VGRLDKAFAGGNPGSYEDWNVALDMHEFNHEMFREGDGKSPMVSHLCRI
jgi:hypothetical protein